MSRFAALTLMLYLPHDHQEIRHDTNEEFSHSYQTHEVGHFSFFGPWKNTRSSTCNRFMRICRANGIPGSSCFKKKCVNVMKDRNNGGKCGKKCIYNKDLAYVWYYFSFLNSMYCTLWLIFVFF